MQKSENDLLICCEALSNDPTNKRLIDDVKNAALLKSAIRDKFILCLELISKASGNEDAFLLCSMIGQKYLHNNHPKEACRCLESALRIDTKNLNLKSSIISSLAYAYWSCNDTNLAVVYMQQDLLLAKQTNDWPNMFRSYGNLGSVCYCEGEYHKSIAFRRLQLHVAFKLKSISRISEVLSHLGHVSCATGDYSTALSCHQRCIVLFQKLNNKLLMAKEISNVGVIHLLEGNFTQAITCHKEHLKISKELKQKAEEARAYSNLGSCYHFAGNFKKSIECHEKVKAISIKLEDELLKSRAYAGLGHAYRSEGNYSKAKICHEKQLDISLNCHDKTGEGRACSNLGVIYQLCGEFEAAFKLHEKHLDISIFLGDSPSKARAHANMGIALSSMGNYRSSIEAHKKELKIFRKIKDLRSECSTLSNLAFAYEGQGMREEALSCYEQHLKIARNLKDVSKESQALLKLANYQCLLKDYAKALPFYQQHLALSQQTGNLQAKLLSLHGLGYTNFHMERFREAIDYYLLDLETFKSSTNIAVSLTNEDLIAAIKQNVIKCSESDKLHLCHIFCNLGLSYAAFNELEKATLLQKNFLDLSKLFSQNKTVMFCALGNLGDIELKTNNPNEAKKYFELQSQIAKKYGDKKLEALACNNLGVVYYKMDDYKSSLDFVNKELKLNRDLKNAKGEVRTLLFIGRLQIAMKCHKEAQTTFTEGLRQSKRLECLMEEAELLCCLAVCCMKQKNYDVALDHLKEEIPIVDQLPVSCIDHFKRQANLDAGICCALMKNFRESINYYEKYLEHSTGFAHHEMKACRLLAEAHDECGNLYESIFCCKKGFLLAIQYKCLDTLAYFNLRLGLLCKKMGCINLASSFLMKRLDYDMDVIDHNQEIRTRDSLGQVLIESKKFQEALETYEKLLQLCQQNLNHYSHYIFKAHYRLATCFQHQGDLEKALTHVNRCLNISMKSGSVSQKLRAYLLIALLYYELDMTEKSMDYFEEGLELLNSENSLPMEEERKFRQCLGFVYWKQKKFSCAEEELSRAVHIIEEQTVLKENSSYIEELNPLTALIVLLKVLIDMKKYKEALMYSENVRQMKTYRELYQIQHSNNCMMMTALLSPLLTLSCKSDQISSLMLLNDDDNLSLSNNVPCLNRVKHVLKHVFSFPMLEEAVNSQSSAVICFSLGLNFLQSWLLLPGQGLVKYHETDIKMFATNIENDLQSLSSNFSLLDHAPSRSAFKLWNKDLSSFEHISNSQDCINYISPFTEILHKNREVGSILDQMQSSNFSKLISESQPLMSFMFNLFIGPFDEILHSSHSKGITFVIESDIFNVPFSVLRPNSLSPFVFQKYHINFISSFKYLLNLDAHNKSVPESTTNNDVQQSLPSRYDHAILVNGICQSKAKAKMLNDIEKMLQGKILTHCSKKDALNALLNAEMVHLSCNLVDQSFTLILDASALKKSQNSDSACGDFLFTLSDFLDLKVHATFVVLDVISSCLDEGIAGDSVKKFADALLESGVKCVLVPLWTVGGEAVQCFFKIFYSTLTQGYSVLTSLHHTMTHMRSQQNFASIKYWACWNLVGNDVIIQGRTGLLQKGLVNMLKSYKKSREAMRIILHLVEKSLKRIEDESSSSMFVTNESILKRVGSDCRGWEEVMRAAGFKFVFDDSSQSILVFFPLDDDFQYLQQSSLALSSFLGLSFSLLESLSQFAHLQSVGFELLNGLCEMLKNQIHHIVLRISKATFGTNGVADFLYKLDFLVVSRTLDAVIFSSKSLNWNVIVLIVTSLAFLFDPHRFARDKSWVKNLMNPHICLEYSPSQQSSRSSSRKKHSIDSGCMSFETSNANLNPNNIKHNGFSSQKYDSIDQSSVSTAYEPSSAEHIETDSGTHTWSKITDTNDSPSTSYYSHLPASHKKHTASSNLANQAYKNSRNMSTKEFTRNNVYFTKPSRDDSPTESRI